VEEGLKLARAARRNGGDLLPFDIELRIKFRDGVQALARHHNQAEVPVRSGAQRNTRPTSIAPVRGRRGPDVPDA
jgi:hypothetical protein